MSRRTLRAPPRCAFCHGMALLRGRLIAFAGPEHAHPEADRKKRKARWTTFVLDRAKSVSRSGPSSGRHCCNPLGSLLRGRGRASRSRHAVLSTGQLAIQLLGLLLGGLLLGGLLLSSFLRHGIELPGVTPDMRRSCSFPPTRWDDHELYNRSIGTNPTVT